MKDFEIIVEFRRAYQKLNYWKNGLTISYIYEWTKAWCDKRGMDDIVFNCFYQLALAYVEKENEESIILSHLQKKRKKGNTL